MLSNKSLLKVAPSKDDAVQESFLIKKSAEVGLFAQKDVILSVLPTDTQFATVFLCFRHLCV